MELLAGFAWPVPRAFAGAVSACRFEQGDVLYSDASAYEPWTRRGRRPAQRIQVLDPPKTARALASEADGKRFFSNWTSPVEVTVSSGGEPAGPACVSTQGRLFTGLWRGDASWLDPGHGEPEPPLLQRDLHKRLDETVGFFRSRFSDSPEPGCLYLAAVDESSDASLVKAHGIEALLVERAKGVVLAAKPSEAGLEGGDRFHPALVLHAVAVPTYDAERVEEWLAGLLYAGGDEGRGRFSLTRHGLLVSRDESSA